MKKCLKNVVIIVLMAMGISIFPQKTYAIILYPMADCVVSSAAVNTNFNNYNQDLDSELWTGVFSDGSNALTYLKFNLAGLPGAGSAILYLYNGVDFSDRSSFDEAGVEIYTTSSLWTERRITWNNRPAFGAFAVSGIVENATGWYSWDVTSSVRNHAGGILSLAAASGGAGHIYYGRETSDGYTPYLDVNIVPEPSTALLFGGAVLIFLPYIRKRA